MVHEDSRFNPKGLVLLGQQQQQQLIFERNIFFFQSTFPFVIYSYLVSQVDLHILWLMEL